MGLERTAVSTKLSPENTEFLDGWGRKLRPHEVSQSSLVDLSVRIVRHLVASGKLSLEPGELQAFFGNGCNGGNAEKRKGVQS